jgi:hypothetical protein
MLKSKIEKFYEIHDCQRPCQGDILRDFTFFTIYINGDVKRVSFPYIVILSQDCDLEQGLKKINSKSELLQDNQYLPNILFSPAFPLDSIRQGTHLTELFNIEQERINSESVRRIKTNKDERYHYLDRYLEYQVPELVIDFKAYYAVSKDYFLDSYKDFYIATINELFREFLSQRFSNFLSRIGLPEINSELKEEK